MNLIFASLEIDSCELVLPHEAGRGGCVHVHSHPI